MSDSQETSVQDEQREHDEEFRQRVFDACVDLLDELDGQFDAVPEEVFPASTVIARARVPADWFEARFGSMMAALAALNQHNMAILFGEILDQLADRRLTCWQDGMDAIYRVFVSHCDDRAMIHLGLEDDSIAERLYPLLVMRFLPSHREHLRQPLSMAVHCWTHLIPGACVPEVKRYTDEVLKMIYGHMRAIVAGDPAALQQSKDHAAGKEVGA